jgi:hypothetical protein
VGYNLKDFARSRSVKKPALKSIRQTGNVAVRIDKDLREFIALQAEGTQLNLSANINGMLRLAKTVLENG